MNSKITPKVLQPKKSSRPSTKDVGDKGEAVALTFLLANGLSLVQKNYKTPGRGGGEIDLIMRDYDNTLVFVEVKKRRSLGHGGAANSITLIKQKRISKAALAYLSHFTRLPACRFDVVLIESAITWIKAAFNFAEADS